MHAMDLEQANGTTMDAERLLSEAAQAADGVGARASVAATDLFLPADARLSDQQRGTMDQLLAKLVQAIEQDLRRRLIGHVQSGAPSDLLAAIASDQVEIASPILFRSGLLQDSELVALLLRRTEEHRLVSALRLKAVNDAGEVQPAPAAPLLDRLLESGEAGLAEGAMALLIAESRRYDRFQEPLLARTDLPAEIQHRLVWWSVAALRDHINRNHVVGAAFVDRALTAAASEALAAHDESEALESRATQLARLLARHDKLDDALIVDAIGDARLMLAIAGLAVRAGIDFVSAWEMAADPARLTILLRAVGMRRGPAISVLLALHEDKESQDRLAAFAVAFDALEWPRAQEAIRPWKLDTFYRKAIADLSRALARREAIR
ncbi:DUF2336 domain-containing protein [Flavisphingomonas formosensis]|uniref:DUF2336 domain-containing protein n=1 Tax=Flavisphingomonas formosensis TaxID=861534 RepID=UPI0012FCE8D0|nr:DUF2336 domain-containing protein [Sphingomonas formosensis]